MGRWPDVQTGRQKLIILNNKTMLILLDLDDFGELLMLTLLGVKAPLYFAHHLYCLFIKNILYCRLEL